MRLLRVLPFAVLGIAACTSADQTTASDGGVDSQSPDSTTMDVSTVDSGVDTSIADSSVADAADASMLGKACSTDLDCGPGEACPQIFELGAELQAVCKKASVAVNGCAASPPTVTIGLNQVVYIDYDFASSTRTEHLNGSCTDPLGTMVDQVFVLHVSAAGMLEFWSDFSSVGMGTGSSCPGTCAFTAGESVSSSHAVVMGDYYVTLFGSSGGGGHIELQLQ